MKVLLNSNNQRKEAIGPVLTICKYYLPMFNLRFSLLNFLYTVTGFTNHALDQFLEHLLHIGIKNIVRLGGRSKSEEIRPFALEEQCRNQRKSAEQRLAI